MALFTYSCGPSGFHVTGGSWVNPWAVRKAEDMAQEHRASCPYCRFKKDTLNPVDTRQDVG